MFLSMKAAGVILTHQSICATCLSQDRKLFPVNDNKSHASFLVNVSEGDELCWECHFFVLKVAAFRSRAARAQALLAGALHQTNETKITSLSNLKMTPVLSEVSLEPSDLLRENVKTETIEEDCEDTLYECPIEDNYNSNYTPCYQGSDDENHLPLILFNEQTEDKYDEGAYSDAVDDDVTNATELLNDKDLLIRRQEPERDADAAAEYRHVSAGDEPARSRTRPHPLLRSCFVKLDRVPSADDQLSSGTIPVPFDCNFTHTQVNQQATLDDGNVLHASSEQSRLCTPTQTLMVDKSHTCNTCGEHFISLSKFNKHIMLHTGEKSFICDTCDKRFYKKLSLISHLRVHANNKFCCDSCDKQFYFKSALITHLRVHTVGKPFICDICKKRFKHEYSLTKHQLLHISGEHNCKICGKHFYLKSSLVKHMQRHRNEKRLVCNYCNKQCIRASHLIVHLRIHTGERPFCCEICGKQMITKDALRIHLRKHTAEQPYSCDKCEKRFKHSSALKVHLKRHIKKELFICDICNKRFTSKHTLIRHLATHSTIDGPFGCNVCGKRYKVKASLKYHLNTHTRENAIICDICQKLCLTKASFQLHTRLVHTHKDERPFSCEICRKRYKMKAYLVRHMRTHTGERPFGCDVCGKRFNCGSFLKAHTRIHTGEKPFCCEICGKRFNQKSAMTTHLRTHTVKKERT